MESELVLEPKRATLAKGAWDEFVYGGHLVSIGDASALSAIGLVLAMPIDWWFPVVVYAATLSGNLANRYGEFSADAATNPERTQNNSRLRPLYPVIIAVLIVAASAIALTRGSVAALIALWAAYGSALLYTAALKGVTRRVLGFKGYVVAGFYSLMIVFLVLFYHQPFSVAVSLATAFYFLRILISASFCDIKDIEGDAALGLRTWAVEWGPVRLTRNLHMLNLVSVVPLVIGIALGVLPVSAIGLALTVGYAAYYLNEGRQNPARSSLFAALADGEFLFWWPAVAGLSFVISFLSS